MKSTIAFVGLGLMGSGMARTLLRAGYDVRLYNRTRAKAEAVANMGGAIADSPAEAVRGADVVITMVADPAALSSVVEGPAGIAAAIPRGAVLIDSSTVSPATTLRIHALLRARGADMLDAPVFGSKHEAESGQLGFIVGGDAAVLARVQPILDTLGRTTHVGPNGSGAYAKLVVNLVIAGTMQAFSEGMVLATRAGLDPAAMLQVLLSSRARSGIIEMKAPRILQRDFTPFFPLELMAKDMRLVDETAADLGLGLPVAAALRDTYARCLAAGLAREDFAAAIKLLERAANLEVGERPGSQTGSR